MIIKKESNLLGCSFSIFVFHFSSILSFTISLINVVCNLKKKNSLRINRNTQHLRIVTDETNSIKASFCFRQYSIASVDNAHTFCSGANASFQFNYNCNIHSRHHHQHHHLREQDYQDTPRQFFIRLLEDMPWHIKKKRKNCREKKRQSASHLSLACLFVVRQNNNTYSF